MFSNLFGIMKTCPWNQRHFGCGVPVRAAAASL